MPAQRVRQPGVCAVQHNLLHPIKEFLKSSQGSCAQSPAEGGLSLQAVIALPAQSHTPPAHRQPCCCMFAPACQPAPTHRAAGVPLLNRLSMVSLAPSSERSLSEASLPNLVPALRHPHVTDEGNLNSAPQRWVLVTHLLLCATLLSLTLGWKDGAFAPSLPIYCSVHRVSSPLPAESCIQILLQDDLL